MPTLPNFEPISFWQAGNLTRPAWLRHGFSHRRGGVSTDMAFGSLNTGLHVGDTPGAVIENRRRVAQAMGFSLDNMVCAQQIHGSQVAIACAEHAGRGATEYADALLGVDALITNTPGLLLTLFFADCLPVFFADPVHHAVGIAHAGWKGLTGGVLQNTIRAMTEAWGTRAADLLVAVGPGIGPDWFEVGPEVATQFPNDTRAMPNTEKPHVDLPNATRRVLLNVGILPQNLMVSNDCTASLPKLYFSHRRDNGRTGRMAGVIGITPLPPNNGGF